MQRRKHCNGGGVETGDTCFESTEQASCLQPRAAAQTLRGSGGVGERYVSQLEESLVSRRTAYSLVQRRKHWAGRQVGVQGVPSEEIQRAMGGQVAPTCNPCSPKCPPVSPLLGQDTMWYSAWLKGAVWKLPSMCQPVRPTPAQGTDASMQANGGSAAVLQWVHVETRRQGEAAAMQQTGTGNAWVGPLPLMCSWHATCA